METEWIDFLIFDFIIQPMTSCLLLAAGFSSRFGAPKALAKWGSVSVIKHILKSLICSSIDNIVVVLGAHREAIEPHLLKHTKVHAVYNKDYILGQTSSFKTGLVHISADEEMVFLLPVDYPFILASSIDTLIARHNATRPLITIPVFEGRKGHPPLFSLSLRQEFMQLANDEGLDQIVRRHSAETTFVPVNDRGVVSTFNTPEEFDALRASFPS